MRRYSSTQITEISTEEKQWEKPFKLPINLSEYSARRMGQLRLGFNREVAILMGIVVAIEGVVVMYIAGPIEISGFGGVRQQLVLIAGAQLFILGIIVIGAWILRGRKALNRILNGKVSAILRYVPIMIGAILAIEGLVVVAMAGYTLIPALMTAPGLGGVQEHTVAKLGWQLFIIGIVVLITGLPDRLLSSSSRRTVAQAAVVFLLLMIPALIMFS